MSVHTTIYKTSIYDAGEPSDDPEGEGIELFYGDDVVFDSEAYTWNYNTERQDLEGVFIEEPSFYNTYHGDDENLGIVLLYKVPMGDLESVEMNPAVDFSQLIDVEYSDGDSYQVNLAAILNTKDLRLNAEDNSFGLYLTGDKIESVIPTVPGGNGSATTTINYNQNITGKWLFKIRVQGDPNVYYLNQLGAEFIEHPAY